MIDHQSVTLSGGHFQWDDPLLIEAQLSDEEKMIRDTARQYAQEKLAPRIRDWNRNETFDRVVMREMGELGFLGAPLEGYGCAGIGYVGVALVTSLFFGITATILWMLDYGRNPLEDEEIARKRAKHAGDAGSSAG